MGDSPRRRLAVVLAASLLVALPVAPPAAAETVQLDLGPERNVILSGLPPILADEEVRDQLTTGLTTTLLFRFEPRRREGTAGARVEVRYELWDEEFHVAVLTVDGRLERRVLSSFEELSAWWSGLGLRVMDEEAWRSSGRSVRLVLDVIPFSQAERDDTERWFSEVIGAAARSGGEETDRSPDDREESLGNVLSVLIATSIQRRALTSYRWPVAVPRSPSP